MTPAATISLPALSVRAAVGSINAEERTVDVIWSTGADVQRYDYYTDRRYIERLSMDAKHIRLGRLNDGASVLDSHSGYGVRNVLGAVEPGSVRLEGGKGIATLRFSRRASVDEIWQDVRDGILKFVSVGYRVLKFEEDPKSDPRNPVRTAVDWEPYEISLVPMPADAGAKVRADQVESYPCVIVRAATEEPMERETPNAGAEPQPAPVPTPAPAPAADDSAVRAERARVSAVHEIASRAGLGADFVRQHVDAGTAIDQVRAMAFDQLAARSAQQPPAPTGTQIRMGEDAADKMSRGVLAWLLVRSGVAAMVAKHDGVDVRTFDAGEFRGMTLLDIARESLERAGVSTRGMDKMTLVGRAFTMRNITQSTSDFTVLLENTMHKVLQAAYGIQPNTWSRWCRTGSVSDFRAHNRYRMGALSVLDALTETGEFKNKAITDAEKASITASTKGNIIAISRQAIVNDDIGGLTDLLSRLGRAAALSVEVDAYALLGQNSGLGPTQGDGQPLFHSNRANVNATASSITAAGLDADRVVMAQQREPGGVEFIDLRPSVLLVPVSQGGQARVVNASQYDPDNITNKAQMRPNVVAGLFNDIVDTPRITSTRRYLFADPAIAPVFEVAFMEGQASPVLETRDGWRQDGTEMRVRFDYGVAAIDWRGAVTNAGQ